MTLVQPGEACPVHEVDERFPLEGPVTVQNVLDRWTAKLPDGELAFGDERVLEFLATLSRLMLRPGVTRRHPELAALGTFLRPRRLRRLLSEVPAPSGVLRFPLGRVLHVPPTNVATVFVYSWALAALAGNRNVVRLSPHAPEVTSTLVGLLRDARESAHPAIGASQLLISYGRDEHTTSALTRRCDLRVLWGGDEAVTTLRSHPLRPGARDLSFPDRSSLAVVSVDGWSRADLQVRRRVAAHLYNDVFWFDQAACSSPRTIVWLGELARGESCATELMVLLAEEARGRVVSIDAAMAVHKRVSAYGLALSGAARSLTFEDSTLAHVHLAQDAGLNRRWLGTGALASLVLTDVRALGHIVEAKDQTVTHACLTPQDVEELARVVGAEGIDRVVPVGRALDFGPVWDGYDLLEQFARRTVVDVGRP